jgi:hypothetical protein
LPARLSRSARGQWKSRAAINNNERILDMTNLDSNTKTAVASLTDKGLLPLNVNVLDMAALEDLTDEEREVLARIVQHHIAGCQCYLTVMEYDKRQQWPKEL